LKLITYYAVSQRIAHNGSLSQNCFPRLIFWSV
jgi:hypothetical protein